MRVEQTQIAPCLAARRAISRSWCAHSIQGRASRESPSDPAPTASSRLFALLYKKTGSLGGVVTFRTQATSGVDGPLDWFRPGLAGARLGLHGSRYVKPAAGGRALDLMNGLGKLRFSGGAMFATPVEKNLTIGTDNLVSFDAPDGTTLKIKTTSGLLSGKFVSPPGTKPKSFSGILQQAAKMGGGAYSGTAQTGLVELLPR